SRRPGPGSGSRCLSSEAPRRTHAGRHGPAAARRAKDKTGENPHMSHEARRSEGQADDSPIGRLATGKRELDDVLGGGIPENSINIIMGEPGSGKTTLAEEFVFANAHDDGRTILYLTTLSEQLEKILKYLQQFRFFDLTKMGSVVQYEGLGTDLAVN